MLDLAGAGKCKNSDGQREKEAQKGENADKRLAGLRGLASNGHAHGSALTEAVALAPGSTTSGCRTKEPVGALLATPRDRTMIGTAATHVPPDGSVTSRLVHVAGAAAVPNDSETAPT